MSNKEMSCEVRFDNEKKCSQDGMFRNFVFSIEKTSYSCNHLITFCHFHSLTWAALIYRLASSMAWSLIFCCIPVAFLLSRLGLSLFHFSHFQFCDNYFVTVYIRSGIFSVQIYQTLSLSEKQRNNKITTNPLVTESWLIPSKYFLPLVIFLSSCLLFLH